MHDDGMLALTAVEGCEGGRVADRIMPVDVCQKRLRFSGFGVVADVSRRVLCEMIWDVVGWSLDSD